MRHLHDQPRMMKGLAVLLVVIGLGLVGQGLRTVSAEHGLPLTQQQTYDLVFSTSGQSMWGPGTEASPGDLSYDVLPDSLTSWSGTLDGTDKDTILGVTYGGGIEGGSAGGFGVTANFSAGAGSVGVDAPISVTLDYPTPESFRAGEVVSITSTLPELESTGAVITGTRAVADTSINADFNLDTHANAEVCLYECIDIPFFTPIDESGEYEAVGIDENGDFSVAGIDLFTVDPTEIHIDPLTEFITGVGGDFGVPEVDVSSSVSGGKIVGTSYDNDFVDLELDLDKWYSRMAGGLPLGLGVPELGQGASGSYDIVDVDLTFNVSQHHRFEFTPGDVEVELAFPEAVEFWVYDGATLVSTGTSSTVSFLAGQQVDFVATDSNMEVTPTFTMVNNVFSNDTETYFDTGFETLALKLVLDVDGFTIVDPIPIYPQHWHADLHWHDADWHCHNSATVLGEWICYDWHLHSAAHYHDHGYWHQHYIPAVVFGGADVNEGPVHSQSHPVSRDTDTNLFDGDQAPWELGGFTSQSGAAFTLNPNHEPTAVPTGTTNVDEGSLASFDGSGSFDLDGDPLTYSWDYGDGSPPGSGVTTDHIYADDGALTVKLKANDGHGFGPEASHIVTVNNVAPTVDAGSDGAVLEGDLFAITSATFNDKGTLDIHTANIDWGDGTNSAGAVTESPTGPPGSSAGSDGTVTGSHVYADDGIYTVTVTVTDDDGDSGSDTLEVIVGNRAPTLDAGADQGASEGQTVSLPSATFNDLGTADTHTATINWGDGTATEPGSVTESPSGPPGNTDGTDGTISGTHVYADNGVYTVEVVVTDDQGDSATDQLVITVGNVDPTVDAGPDATSNEGSLFSLVSSTFSDLGTSDTHTASIDWGDGTPNSTGLVSEIPFGPPGSTSGMSGSVFGSHTYADDGAYVVEIEVTDDDGGVHSDSLVVTVENVSPSINPSGVDEVIIFSTFEIDSSFSDVGFDCPVCSTLEDFTATIDWGDSTPVEPASVTEVPGSPGTPTTGSVQATHEYNWIGTYTVLVTVTDDDGGTSSFTHDVEVLGGRQLNVSAMELLEPFSGESRDIRKAIKELEDAIEWKLWDDELHVDDKHGHKVFSEQKKAVDKLLKALGRKTSDDDDDDDDQRRRSRISLAAAAAAEEAIRLILVSDQVIAELALEEAEAAEVLDPKKQKSVDKELAKARSELVKAQDDLDRNRYTKAIDHYRKAVQHADKAVKHANHSKSKGKGKDKDDDDDDDDDDD